MNENEVLQVYIRSRKRDYYKGPAHSVTSKNDKGVFDILPYHANFITLIKDLIVIDQDKKSQNKIEIKSGVLSVASNRVDVYLDL